MSWWLSLKGLCVRYPSGDWPKGQALIENFEDPQQGGMGFRRRLGLFLGISIGDAGGFTELRASEARPCSHLVASLPCPAG